MIGWTEDHLLSTVSTGPLLVSFVFRIVRKHTLALHCRETIYYTQHNRLHVVNQTISVLGTVNRSTASLMKFRVCILTFKPFGGLRGHPRG